MKLTNTWKHASLISIASLIYVLLDWMLKLNGVLDVFYILMVAMVACVVEANQYTWYGSKRGYWQRRGLDTIVDMIAGIGTAVLIVFHSWIWGIAILMICSPWIVKLVRDNV